MNNLFTKSKNAITINFGPFKDSKIYYESDEFRFVDSNGERGQEVVENFWYGSFKTSERKEVTVGNINLEVDCFPESWEIIAATPKSTTENRHVAGFVGDLKKFTIFDTLWEPNSLKRIYQRTLPCEFNTNQFCCDFDPEFKEILTIV